MNIRKTKKILKRMLDSLNKNIPTDNYAYFCSSNFKSKVKTYKGFPVYYLAIIKKDTIYFTKDTLHYDKE